MVGHTSTVRAFRLALERGGLYRWPLRAVVLAKCTAADVNLLASSRMGAPDASSLAKFRSQQFAAVGDAGRRWHINPSEKIRW